MVMVTVSRVMREATRELLMRRVKAWSRSCRH